jgi:hypothetical protein
MIKLLKGVHQHSLELEEGFAKMPKSEGDSKVVERTFGVIGSMVLAGGFSLITTGVQSEITHTYNFATKHEASIIDVAKMGLLDPPLIAVGGLVAYIGLEDIALANGVLRRRHNPDENGVSQMSSGE